MVCISEQEAAAASEALKTGLALMDSLTADMRWKGGKLELLTKHLNALRKYAALSEQALKNKR